MKRIFVLITVIIVILSLSACDLNPIVNKLNGNEAAAKAQQEKEKYTELADGTYLYKQSGVSTENISSPCLTRISLSRLYLLPLK